MHDIKRNIFYQIKKQSSTRSDPFYNPNSQQDSIRQQNNKLRTKLRKQDTQIIRLNAKIDELNQKIKISQIKFDSINDSKQQNIKQAVNQFSKVPMILENKQLKQIVQQLRKQIYIINGSKNQLEIQVRQLRSDKKGLQMKIKQFNILEKMREQRFKDQVERLTPIVIEQPAQYSNMKNAITYLTKYLRQNTVQVLQNIFILSSKQCQGNKKLNSFNIFNNYFQQLKQRKSYGYASTISSYRSIRKVMKMIDQRYGEIDQNDLSQAQQTIDQWVIHSVVQIVNGGGMKNQQARKLFRLLALKYRCKYPIKGQNWQTSQKVKQYLDNVICDQIIRIILAKKQNIPQNNQDNKNGYKQSLKNK